MSLERILETVRAFEGVLELAPTAGSAHPETGEYPEISWGDHFFYYAPDGEVPRTRQPYATIVTNDYHDDRDSRLDAPGRWRLNIHVGADAVPAVDDPGSIDFAASDVVLPHPLYGPYGWISIVNPGERTLAFALEALRAAHLDDRRRVERRAGG